MKKVLLIATVQSHIAQFHKPLINVLHENGYEVHVAARDNLSEKNGLVLDTADKTFNVNFSRSPYSFNNIVVYKQIKHIISENNYQFIHCNTPMGGVVGRLAARKARKSGTKVIYTAHGFHFFKGAPLINWLVYYPIEKILSGFTDVLITINKEDYERAQTFKAKRAEYIHGVGANALRFKPYDEVTIAGLKRKMGIENQNIILCIGELNKNKNQQTIIKAMPEVIKAVSNTKLLIAGNGPNYNMLRQLTYDLKLKDYIEFLGYTTKLEEYINISDVVVSASFREGLPLNIVEALLCRKPVVASINRGHKELVEHGVNGYLANPKKPSEFSKYILKIINDKEFDFTYSSNVWLNISKFTDENVINELTEIYNGAEK